MAEALNATEKQQTVTCGELKSGADGSVERFAHSRCHRRSPPIVHCCDTLVMCVCVCVDSRAVIISGRTGKKKKNTELQPSAGQLQIDPHSQPQSLSTPWKTKQAHIQKREKHMRAASFSLVLWQCVSVPVLSCCRATVCVHAFVCELHSRMPSHDSSFVNTPLLLLPSALPFHLCALSLWMTAWLQSSRPPGPNLLYVLPQSLV